MEHCQMGLTNSQYLESEGPLAVLASFCFYQEALNGTPRWRSSCVLIGENR